MINFEYKVVPAPTRGLKAKGVKGTQARFANALQTVMNELGAEGWEYQRTDTLPVEERQGLTGKTTSFQNMLVFRRTLPADVEQTPAVAALIEDQSAVMAANEAQDDAAQDDAADEAVGNADINDDMIEAAQSSEDEAEHSDDAAQERVNETLSSNFAFPWAKRQMKPNARREDDPQHAPD